MAKRESSIPVATLVERMINDIHTGAIIDEKNKLPTEPELMERYAVTRYTLRQALSRLSVLGYIYQAHGIGTFGRPRQDDNYVSVQNAVGLSTEMARQGKQLTTTDYSIDEVTAADAAFTPSAGKIDPATRLWEIKRYRMLDGKPYTFEHSYYLRDIVGDVPESALKGSLFAFVAENKTLTLGFQDKVMEAAPLAKENAWFFDLAAGAPMLIMNDDSYLSSGQLFAFSKLSYDYRMGKFFMFTRL
ncbi:GntR family transcriptional regulator [Lacticaseibacillus zhaodongensis]|uniref:GntR family transcriptional regulator n=1 Tax=Lacticaseibacillus zhaodongensis TaxID=2668065 RepID=UPI0012D2C28E|nr:GntR family transcriptional regulator [Lacticaseibacillus zhaodongensis]